jgi:hypothetical protein
MKMKVGLKNPPLISRMMLKMHLNLQESRIGLPRVAKSTCGNWLRMKMAGPSCPNLMVIPVVKI